MSSPYGIADAVSVYVEAAGKEGTTAYEAILLGRGLVWDAAQVADFLRSTTPDFARKIHADPPEYTHFVAKLAAASDTDMASVTKMLTTALNDLSQMLPALAGMRPYARLNGTDPLPSEYLVPLSDSSPLDRLQESVRTRGVWATARTLAKDNIIQISRTNVHDASALCAWVDQYVYFMEEPTKAIFSYETDLYRILLCVRRMFETSRLMNDEELSLVKHLAREPSAANVVQVQRVFHERLDAAVGRYRVLRANAERLAETRPDTELQLMHRRQQMLQSRNEIRKVANRLVALDGRVFSFSMFEKSGWPDLSVTMPILLRETNVTMASDLDLLRLAQEASAALRRRYPQLENFNKYRDLSVVRTKEDQTYIRSACVTSVAAACPLGPNGADHARSDNLAKAVCDVDSSLPALRQAYLTCRDRSDAPKCLSDAWKRLLADDPSTVCAADVTASYTPGEGMPATKQIVESGCAAGSVKHGSGLAKCLIQNTMQYCVREVVEASPLLSDAENAVSPEYCVHSLLKYTSRLRTLLHPERREPMDPCQFSAFPEAQEALKAANDLCNVCFKLSSECEPNQNEPMIASKQCVNGWVRYCRSQNCPSPLLAQASNDLVKRASKMLRSDVTTTRFRKQMGEEYDALLAARVEQRTVAAIKKLKDQRAPLTDQDASRVRGWLSRLFEMTKSSGGVSSKLMSELESNTLEFVQKAAPIMSSMVVANAILNRLYDIMEASSHLCRTKLADALRDKKLFAEADAECNQTVPQVDFLREAARLASTYPPQTRLARFDALVEQRRLEWILEQTQTLASRMKRDSARYLSTMIFSGRHLRAEWESRYAVVQWYNILRAQPRVSTRRAPLRVAPYATSSGQLTTAELVDQLDDSVLELMRERKLNPCVFTDVDKVTLSCDGSTLLGEYGMWCADDEAMIFLVNVLTFYRPPSPSEGDACTQPLEFSRDALLDVYANFATRIQAMRKRRVPGHAGTSAQRKVDLLVMQFMCEFAMDCVVRRDPGLSAAKRALPKDEGQALPTQDDLYVLRFAVLCLPRTSQETALKLLQQFTAICLAPLVAAVHAGVTQMMSGPNSGVEKAFAHTDNITEVVDKLAGVHLEEKVDKLKDQLTARRRSHASNESIQLFEKLRLLHDESHTPRPKHSTSLIGGLLGVNLAFRRFGNVLSIVNPTKAMWKKIMPTFSLLSSTVKTGATIGALRKSGLDGVVDGALRKFLKLKGSSASAVKRPTADLELKDARQKAFWQVQSTLLASYEACNSAVFAEYSDFVNVLIANEFTSVDEGTPEEGGGVDAFVSALFDTLLLTEPRDETSLLEGSALAPAHNLQQDYLETLQRQIEEKGLVGRQD